MNKSGTVHSETFAAPSVANVTTPPIQASAASPAKLGLSLLVALVVGSIIGSGIFGLPQNMAAGAGAGAILIGWTITGIGMLLLVRVYQMLSMRKIRDSNSATSPDLRLAVFCRYCVYSKISYLYNQYFFKAFLHASE